MTDSLHAVEHVFKPDLIFGLFIDDIDAKEPVTLHQIFHSLFLDGPSQAKQVILERADDADFFVAEV